MPGALRILRSLRRPLRRGGFLRKLPVLLSRSRACQRTGRCRTSVCATSSTRSWVRTCMPNGSPRWRMRPRARCAPPRSRSARSGGPRRRQGSQPKACRQAGGSDAVQSGHRSRYHLPALGGLCRGRTQRDRGRLGLDRLRRRRPGHPAALHPLRAWPCDAAVVAERREARAQEPAQPA